MVTDGPQVRRLSLMNSQKCLIMIVISISWSLISWWFWDIGAGLCFEMLKYKWNLQNMYVNCEVHLATDTPAFGYSKCSVGNDI